MKYRSWQLVSNYALCHLFFAVKSSPPLRLSHHMHSFASPFYVFHGPIKRVFLLTTKLSNLGYCLSARSCPCFGCITKHVGEVGTAHTHTCGEHRRSSERERNWKCVCVCVARINSVWSRADSCVCGKKEKKALSCSPLSLSPSLRPTPPPPTPLEFQTLVPPPSLPRFLKSWEQGEAGWNPTNDATDQLGSMEGRGGKEELGKKGWRGSLLGRLRRRTLPLCVTLISFVIDDREELFRSGLWSSHHTDRTAHVWSYAPPHLPTIRKRVDIQAENIQYNMVFTLHKFWCALCSQYSIVKIQLVTRGLSEMIHIHPSPSLQKVSWRRHQRASSRFPWSPVLRRCALLYNFREASLKF